MRGVNKVIIVGNVGKDPEINYTKSGAQIVNASVATSESWKDKQTGQNQEKTEWHRVVFFNRLAEIAGEYLKKGAKVYIEGKLQTRKWTDQQGIDRYSTDIQAYELQMLGNYSVPSRAQDSGPSSYQEAPDGSPPAAQRPAAQRQQPVPQLPSAMPPAPGMEMFDDDSIPF